MEAAGAMATDSAAWMIVNNPVSGRTWSPQVKVTSAGEVVNVCAHIPLHTCMFWRFLLSYPRD